MAISNGQTITHTDLNTETDANNATLRTRASSWEVDSQVDVVVLDLDSSTALAQRSRMFTPQEDLELRMLGVSKEGGASSINLTVTVKATDGAGGYDTEPTLEKTWSVTLATSGTGVEHNRTAYSTTTGDRLFLMKGVQYEVAVSSDSGTATAFVQAYATFRHVARPRAGQALQPVLYRDATQLSPEDLNLTFEAIERDLNRAVGQRYTRSFFVVPLDEIAFSGTPDDAVEARIRINSPLAYDVEAVEFYADPDGQNTDTWTLTMTRGGTTPAEWTDLAIELDGTNGTYVSASNVVSLHVDASTEVIWSVSSDGTTDDILSAYAVVHIKQDRHAGSPPATFSRPNFRSGGTPPPVTVDDALDQWDADVTSDGNNDKQLRIHIPYVWRNTGPAGPASSDDTIYLPASGKRIDSADFILIRATTSGIDFSVIDEASADVVTATVAASGATTETADLANSAGPDTQGNDDPTDTGDDYTLLLDQNTGSTAILKAYAVLYWT